MKIYMVNSEHDKSQESYKKKYFIAEGNKQHT